MSAMEGVASSGADNKYGVPIETYVFHHESHVSTG